MKILHAPLVIAGNASRLSRAERELGFDSWSIEIGSNKYGYTADERIEGSSLGLEVKRILLLIRAIRNFDVVHFNFGESFFPRKIFVANGDKLNFRLRVYNLYASVFEMKDVWLLSKLKKKIFVTFQGDDLRSPNLINPNKLTLASGAYSERKNSNNLKRAKLWSKYANGIYYLNPDLKQYIPTQSHFLPYSSVDVSTNSKRVVKRTRSKSLVLFHAPSSRDVKGTNSIISVVTQLKLDGFPISLSIVENVNNQEVLDKLSACDYVIDQLLGGWYGGFAVEAMSFGKPVVAWLDPEYFSNVPKELIQNLPIVSATEETLKEVLLNLIRESADEYESRSLASLEFVQKWHDPLSVARITTSHYED